MGEAPDHRDRNGIIPAGIAPTLEFGDCRCGTIQFSPVPYPLFMALMSARPITSSSALTGEPSKSPSEAHVTPCNVPLDVGGGYQTPA